MKVLLVYSGGLDSTVLLYKLVKRHDVVALNFNYGQLHWKNEATCAVTNCARLEVPLVGCELPFVKEEFKSKLLTKAEEIPEGHYTDESMKATVVPFRNGIMLSVAAGYAVSKGCKKVFIANHAGDHPIYPDCREEFISAMRKAIRYGAVQDYYEIDLQSPFCNMTKSEIVELGARLAVRFTATWSCYKGGKIHCGKCGTCVERKEAFQLAGVEDPTRYEDVLPEEDSNSERGSSAKSAV